MNRLYALMLAAMLMIAGFSAVHAEEKLHLYVGSVNADRDTMIKMDQFKDPIVVPNACHGNNFFYVRAHSEDEAKSVALHNGESVLFPTKDGWKNHTVKLEMVPDEFLDPILAR